MNNFLKKYSISEDQFLGKEEISGYLDLSSLTSIPEGFNPTVGGYLYLSSLTSIPQKKYSPKEMAEITKGAYGNS